MFETILCITLFLLVCVFLFATLILMDKRDRNLITIRPVIKINHGVYYGDC